MTQRDGTGREDGGGFRMGNTYPTLYNPMDRSPPGSSVHRILRWQARGFLFRSFTWGARALRTLSDGPPP